MIRTVSRHTLVGVLLAAIVAAIAGGMQPALAKGGDRGAAPDGSNNPEAECGAGIRFVKFEFEGYDDELGEPTWNVLGAAGAVDEPTAAATKGEEDGTEVTAIEWSAPPTTTILKIVVKARDGLNVEYSTSSSEPLYAPAKDATSYFGVSHVTFCLGADIIQEDEDDPALEDLSVVVTTEGSYSKVYTWAIVKSVDRRWSVRSGATAPATYTVAASRTGHGVPDEMLAATVELANPNDVDVDVDLEVGAPCASTQQVTVPANATAHEVTIPCTVSFGQDVDAPSGVSASISWADDGTAGAATLIDWVVTEVDETASISDTLYGPIAAPGATYTMNHATPALEGCTSVTNTATVIGDDTDAALATSAASVNACRQAMTTGGFTIGFWGNKNGAARITANASAICEALEDHESVLGVANCADLVTWVKGILGQATSKGDGSHMLRAQFLATALNVITYSAGNAPLGEVAMAVPGCLTVNQALALADANVAGWIAGGDKVAITTAKTWFDMVNNNTMAVCPS